MSMMKAIAAISALFLWSLLPVYADDELPAPPSTLSPTTVIAQYGQNGEEIVNLGDFWKRAAFERWLYWRQLARLVSEQGAGVLDLESSANPYRGQILNLLNFITNEEQWSSFIWQRLTREAFYREAAAARELAVSECEILQAWSQLIEWPLADDCQVDEEFNSARAEFVASAAHFSGIDQRDLEKSISAQLLSNPLRQTVRAEIPPILELPEFRSRQIRLIDQASAQEVRALLDGGGDFPALMREYGADQATYGNSGELGFLTRGLVQPELDQAFFTAAANEWIGPIETELGFHIARVTETAPQILLRHIQVPDERQAEDLRAELLAGADFAELARQYSHDAPTANRGGEIGYFTRTQLLPEIEDELFIAEVGELLGPLASTFGYHLIEVMDIRSRNLLAQARLLLVATEAGANELKAELAAGASFAAKVAEHSLHEESKASAGNLGYFRPDSRRLPAAVVSAVFAGEIGEIIGPYEWESGYILLEITRLRDEPFAVRAQHILLDSAAAARRILADLRAGADFATLARDHSLDESARGQDGDSLAFFSQGQRSGAFLPGEIHPELEAALTDAAAGEIVGPIETELGYFILLLDERSLRYLNPLEMEEARDAAVDRWLREEHLAQMRNQNDDWREYVPVYPLPGDVSELLAPLNDRLLAPAETGNGAGNPNP